MKFDQKKELSDKEAKEIVSECIDHGTVFPSGHAKDRMRERGYSIEDVFYILKNGDITDKEYNDKANNWKYTFRGEDLDGDSGGVVVAIQVQYRCIVITVLT